MVRPVVDTLKGDTDMARVPRPRERTATAEELAEEARRYRRAQAAKRARELKLMGFQLMAEDDDGVVGPVAEGRTRYV